MDLVSDASSENDLDTESEVEVYSLECSGSDDEVVDSSEDSGTERAWGSNKKLFYEGNDSDTDDHLEEANFTQKKLVSATCRDDYSSPWLRVTDDKHVVEVPAPGLLVETVEPIFERTTTSFEKTAFWLMKYGLKLVDQCYKSLFKPESNGYIQSKIHLMFCYELNVLYFLLLQSNQSKHPVLQQVAILHELLLRQNKLESILQAALLYSPACKLETRSSLSLSHAPLLPATSPTPLEYYNLIRNQQTVDHTFPFQPLGSKECDMTEEKRAITYQIASNKGLLPKRKKEQRNPRVKHRKKYRKALIKRKSQVLPVVHELFKYSGEQCGIRQLIRSIK